MTTNQEAQPPPSQDRAPLVSWLASSDTRIQANSILANPPNALYAVRNAGGIFQQAVGSLDFGVHTLRTPLLLITANTDSKAIKLIREGNFAHSTSLKKELQPLIDFYKNPENSQNDPARLVEKWVDFQVGQAVEHFRQRIDSRRLVVLGGIIDLANLYDRGVGSLIIISANGVTNSGELKHLPIMRRLNEESLDFVGRSGISIFKTDSKNSPGDGEEGQIESDADDLPMFSPQHDQMPEYLDKY